MKLFFTELFEYNFKCNSQVIKRSLEFESKITGRSHKLFDHIFNAHEIWNSRILQHAAVFGVWQSHGLKDWKVINQSCHEASLSIIGQFDFDLKVSYTNSLGDSYVSSVRDILFHIINHSTYHRAQIASDFRANDIEPVQTDYIFFKR